MQFPQAGPDLKPEMKGPQFLAWIVFIISYITGMLSPTMTAFFALATGVIRKGGFPQMNMAYAQSVIPDENTQMLGFLAIGSTASSLIGWSPLLVHGLLTIAATTRDKAHLTGMYSTVVSMVEKTGLPQKISDNQAQWWVMKHDVEVYLGVYLTLGILLAPTSIITAMLYWQIMRMRYLMNVACQQAFGRMDENISGLLGHRFCPGIFTKIYTWIRGFFKSQIDSMVQQA